MKKMNNIKIMTLLGTRPEIIRLSRIMRKFDEYFNHIIVHTNQNYDYELNQVFFDELNIRKPDYVLEVKADTIGQQIGNILSQTEKILLSEKPDAILILGDTNSSLCSIIAKRMKIPIFHIEAGNRCFDDRVPEEINRRIVDHTSDINLCYSEHARRNLLREGLPTQYTYVIGSPLKEVYQYYMNEIENSNILDKLNLEKGEYLLASFHREENVEDSNNFTSILEALNELAKIYEKQIIVSTHPRTKKRLNDTNFELDLKINFMKPFGMFDYIKLQKNSLCTLSDSGTIHEDAAIMKIPAVNLRESNERPETYDVGNVIMSGLDKCAIVHAVSTIISQNKSGIDFKCPYDYQDENCSDKVVRLIIGLPSIVSKKKYFE